MASSPTPTSTTGRDLDQPDNLAAIRRTFAGYQTWLAGKTPDELVAVLTQINAALQTEAQTRLAATIAIPSESSSSIDRLVLRSTPSPSTPGPSPRGQAAQHSPSPPPGPWDRLSSPRGRALAAKLVAAGARSVAGRRVR